MTGKQISKQHGGLQATSLWQRRAAGLSGAESSLGLRVHAAAWGCWIPQGEGSPPKV